MEDFYRIRRLPPYVFEQVNRAKAAARNAGADIIDLGMGNPDLPTPPHVIEKLKETLGKPRTDRYSASRGITGLRKAQAGYYARRFGVKLNPETQVVATLGSKEGFANVAQAITAPGDVDVTVEFTSMSKTFSMAGWRMGFAVGNERIIAALARVKSYLDYGAFTPVQVAATAALNGPDDCIREMRDTYRKRRDALVESFGRAGWDIPPPAASMFAWAPLPKVFREVGSMQFATLLVEKSGVVVSPGVAFGEHGEGFVRIAMVENEQRIRQAARGLRRFLESGIETLHNVVPLANRR